MKKLLLVILPVAFGAFLLMGAATSYVFNLDVAGGARVVGSLTNSALTASALVATDGNKSLASPTIGAGLDYSGGTLSCTVSADHLTTMKITGVNLNAAAPIDIGTNTPPYANFIIEKVTIANPSGSASSATISVNSLTGGSGNNYIAATALSNLSGPVNALQILTPASFTRSYTDNLTVIRLTVAAGVARTADVYITYREVF